MEARREERGRPSQAVQDQNDASGLVSRAMTDTSSSPIPVSSPRHQDNGATGCSVKWLASQIPEFGGTEEENMAAWVSRMNKVALVHNASDAATLLAASSRLVKGAKKWYEIQNGDVIESWIALRSALVKIFDRKIPFYKAMHQIEARRWNLAKESFDQYAIDKIALMHRLNLPEKDMINLLVGGINHTSVRITALSVRADTIEVFLDQMRQITEGLSDLEKKPPLISTRQQK